MKKFLTIAAFFLTVSCSYYNQKISLQATIDNKKITNSQINNTRLEVFVTDSRKNKAIIGTKKIGKEKIFITSNQDLDSFLKQKITRSLQQQGFKIGKKKRVELRIETFSYEATRKFFIGRSNAKAIIKVIVINNKTKAKFYKRYNLSLNKKHFIMPLESTDTETINLLLQETLSQIINDEIFINALNS